MFKDQNKIEFVKRAGITDFLGIKEGIEADREAFRNNPELVRAINDGVYSNKTFNFLDKVFSVMRKVIPGFDVRLHGVYPILGNKAESDLSEDWGGDVARAMKKVMPRADRYPWEYSKMVNDAWNAHVRSRKDW